MITPSWIYIHQTHIKHNLTYTMHIKYELTYTMHIKHELTYTMHIKHELTYTMHIKHELTYTMHIKHELTYSMHIKYDPLYLISDSESHFLYCVILDDLDGLTVPPVEPGSLMLILSLTSTWRTIHNVKEQEHYRLRGYGDSRRSYCGLFWLNFALIKQWRFCAYLETKLFTDVQRIKFLASPWSSWCVFNIFKLYVNLSGVTV